MEKLLRELIGKQAFVVTYRTVVLMSALIAFSLFLLSACGGK